jgi:hypothetical protein
MVEILGQLLLAILGLVQPLVKLKQLGFLVLKKQQEVVQLVEQLVLTLAQELVQQ